MILLSRVNLAYFEFDKKIKNTTSNGTMAPLLQGIVAVETIMALIIAATKAGHRLG